MKLYSIPDFQGSNAAVPVSQVIDHFATPLPSDRRVAMLCFREVSGGTNSSRVGDSTVNGTTGIPLSSSDSLVLPSVGSSPSECFYSLDEIFIYAPPTDTISITYGWW